MNDPQAPQPAAAHWPAPRRRRRLRRTLYVVLGLVLFYTLLGFFGVPLIATRLIVPRVNDRLNGRLTLQRVYYNPYTFLLRLEGLKVTDDAGAVVASFESFEGNLQTWPTIFQSGYHFDEAVLTQPSADVVLMKDGRLNLVALLKPDPNPSTAPSKPLKQIPRIVVRDIGVVSADLAFRDRSMAEPFDLAMRDVSFRLDGLDTGPSHENAHRFDARTDSGEKFQWMGSFTAEPFSSRGTLTITSLDIPRFMPYGGPFSNARIVKGSLSLDLSYELSPLAKPRVAGVTVKSLSLDGVSALLEGDPIYELSRFEISDVRADAVARTVNVGLVSIAGANLHVSRDHAGALNLERVPKNRTPPPSTAAPPSAPQSLTPPQPAPDPDTIPYPLERLAAAINQLIAGAHGAWSLGVDKVALKNWSVAFQDLATPEPVDLAISKLELEAGPVRTSEGYRFPFKTSLQIGDGGTIELAGTVLTPDRKFAADATINNLALAPISPYLPREFPEPVPAVRLAGATLFVSGHADAGIDQAGNSTGAWTGEVRLEAFRADNIKTSTPAASFDRLAVTGAADAALTPEGLTSLAWKGKTSLAALHVDAPLAGPVKLALESLEVDGQATLAPVQGKTRVGFSGNSSLGKLQLDAPQVMESSVALAGVGVRQIEFSSPEVAVSVGDMTVESPTLRAVLPLVPPPTGGAAKATPEDKPRPTPPPAATAPAGPALPQVRIGRFAVHSGTVEVRDNSATPPASITLDTLNVEAKNLSTDGKSIAEVVVAGRLQREGDLNVTGKLDPMHPDRSTDLNITLAGMPLKPYDAFSARFVGYLIDKGRMTMSLPVKVQEGALSGDLKVKLDRFYLGDQVDNPDAPDVPVKLGLALLRDFNEQIDVKIGISGDTKDPKFSIGGIIWQAFFGLIINAATSPFKLLASIIGGDENQDLSNVPFDPGSDALGPIAQSNMESLAKALKERPGLKLVASGRYAREADTGALRAATLRAQMLERVRKDDPTAETLTDEQYRKAIEKSYVELVHVARAGKPVFPDRRDGPPAAGVIRKVRPLQGAEGEVERPTEPFDRMEEAMLSTVEINDDLLADLARRRADKVAEALVQQHAIAAERVKTKPRTGADAAGEGARVEFTIE